MTQREFRLARISGRAHADLIATGIVQGGVDIFLVKELD
jgi:hypothetical protein